MPHPQCASWLGNIAELNNEKCQGEAEGWPWQPRVTASRTTLGKGGMRPRHKGIEGSLWVDKIQILLFSNLVIERK